MLLRYRPRHTAAGILISSRSAWHVVPGGTTKCIVRILENHDATRRPLRLHIGPNTPDPIEGQERRDRSEP